jgi:hypothetical protein
VIALTKRIPIHVWGGLGSQLFAVALFLDLRERFSSRDLLLELHTGGVTSRTSEIDSIFPELGKRQLADFSLEAKSSSSRKSFIATIEHQIVKAIAFFASTVGLVNRCNTDKEFRGLKPWVLTIRGHYAYRSITTSTLLVFSNRLTSAATPDNKSKVLEDSLAIHYRLGDLMTLDEKNPIDVNSIGLEIQRLVQSHNPTSVFCFSDSPQKATELLQSYTLGKPLVSRDLPAVSVIGEACKAKYFIGSNSKISFWIVCLRLFSSPTLHNSLPSGSRVNWIRCSDRELKYASVDEY